MTLLHERPRLAARARVAVPQAVRYLRDGDAEHPTEAVEMCDLGLGPGERADVALVVEKVAERAEERGRSE